jgi:hypothetical protein
MCDYSLHQVASRPAKVGDELITTAFAGTVTCGFSAVGEPNVAICLRAGTEITFEEEAEYRHPFAKLFPRLRFGKLGGKVARFRQVNLDDAQSHHDALEFADGKTVLVTQLRSGQRATVLQLPAERRAASKSVDHQQALPVS